MTGRQQQARAFWPPVSEPPELPPDPAWEKKIAERRRLLAEQGTVVEALHLAYQSAVLAAAQRAKRRKVKDFLAARIERLPRLVLKVLFNALRLGAL